MTDLRTLLELATDEVDSPDLARTSLVAARRRRTWRRGLLASGVAVVAVAGVLVVPRAVDSSDPVREPAGTPTSSPTPTPSTSEEGPAAPPIDESVIHPAWDPSTAADLPQYSIDTLPTVLAPAGGGRGVAGSREGVLALSRDDRDRLAVLWEDAGWWGYRRVREVGDVWASSLSRDGATMAMVGENGLFWCPAAKSCPEWSRVELPEAVLGDDVRITWTQEHDRLLVSGYATGYLVDLDSGETTELPYLGDYPAYDVAPDDRIVSVGLEPRSVTEWDGTTQVRSTLTGDLGGLNDLVLSEDAIAATRIDLSYTEPRAANDGDGLVVLSRDGLTTRAFLPFTGASGQWVDGEQVKPLQWLNKTTVLVSVLLGDTVDLVAWNVDTGDLGYVRRYPASFDVSLRALYPA